MFLSCKFCLQCPKHFFNEFLYLVNILPFFHHGWNILLLLCINIQLHVFPRNLMMSLFKQSIHFIVFFLINMAFLVWICSHFIRCYFGSANHQEVWRITSALENHKYEIADWDLGAGIYIDFYVLKNSMQERNAMDDSVQALTSETNSQAFPWRTVAEISITFFCFRVHSRRWVNHAEVSLAD